jgi:hypothetical protein
VSAGQELRRILGLLLLLLSGLSRSRFVNFLQILFGFFVESLEAFLAAQFHFLPLMDKDVGLPMSSSFSPETRQVVMVAGNALGLAASSAAKRLEALMMRMIPIIFFIGCVLVVFSWI